MCEEPEPIVSPVYKAFTAFTERWDKMEHPANGRYAIIFNSPDFQAAWKIVSPFLNQRQHDLIVKRYGTYPDRLVPLKSIYSVTTERARQIECKAIAILRFRAIKTLQNWCYEEGLKKLHVPMTTSEEEYFANVREAFADA